MCFAKIPNGLHARIVQMELLVFGVQFCILALPVGLFPSREETRGMYAALYRAMLPPSVYARQVLIHE